MATPQSPLTPQMQDALQRGDMRALMQAVRASGASIDLPAARRALQAQLRAQAQQQAAGRLDDAQATKRAAADAAQAARQSMAEAVHRRKRPPTVEMGDRPGETRWVLIVAVLLALAVWLGFGGLDALAKLA